MNDVWADAKRSWHDLITMRGKIWIWILLTIVPISAMFLFFAWRQGVPRETWYLQFLIYWSDPSFILQGLLVLCGAILLSIVVVPCVALLITEPIVYERYDVHDRHCKAVNWSVLLSALAIWISLPVVGPELSANGVATPAGITTVILSLFGYAANWLIRMYDRVQSGRQSAGEPKLPRVYSPPVLPRKGWQTNLDVGALASRIGGVVDGMERWSAFFEASAPTSASIWSFVRNAREPANQNNAFDELRIAGASYQAIKSLKRSAWRGVEALREKLAERLNVQPSQVLFLSNTTRAIEVALLGTAEPESVGDRVAPAPDVVFIPAWSSRRPIEHGAELGRLAALQHLYGTEVKVIELEDLYVNNNTGESAEQELVDRLMSTIMGDARTRKSLLISHVAFASGIQMPISKIITEWEGNNRPFRLIVDGAHAVGHVDTGSMGLVDAYVFSSHKWLFGPAALGIMILRGDGYGSAGDRIYQRLRHLIYEGLAWAGSDPSGERAATVPFDPFVGLSEALYAMEEFQKNVGKDMVTHLRAVREVFRQLCERAKHIEVLNTAPFPQAPAIVNIQKKGTPLPKPALTEVRDRLEKHNHIVTKVVDYPTPRVSCALRLCLPFYLSRGQIVQVVTQLSNGLGEQA